MGIVIHRVDLPCSAGTMVMGITNAEDDRVAHVQVRRGHIDFGTDDILAVSKFTLFHPFKQGNTLAGGSIPPGTGSARFCQGAAIFAHLLGVQFVDVRLVYPDQFHGILIQLLEIVGSKIHAIRPVKAEPAYLLYDRLNILDIFLFGVGIVESQITFALELLCQTEIDADGFGMAYMQVAIRFRRETGMDPAGRAVIFKICLDYATDKIRAGGVAGFSH